MLTMAVGQGDDVDPSAAIATAIDGCRTSLKGLTPQAGILFSAFDSFEPSILEAVRQAFPDTIVMGTTSAAEISSVNGYQEDSITLALFASDSVDITAGLGQGLATDIEAACRSAADEAMRATRREPKVCIVLTEGFAVDPQLTLDAMARALPDGVAMVGGTSAGRDFAAVRPSFQFCGDRVSDDGVAVLLFSGEIAFSTALGTGWRTLGATGTVTGAGSGALHEIDGRPAIEFLARYLDVTGPASYGNPLAVVEAGRRRVVPAGHPGDRPGLRIGVRGRHDPARCRRPAHDRRHRGHPRRRQGRPASARSTSSRSGARPGGRADLLVRGPALPARVEDPGRGGTRAIDVRSVDPDRRPVLLRRDRSGARDRDEPVLQRDVHDAPARNVSDGARPPTRTPRPTIFARRTPASPGE